MFDFRGLYLTGLLKVKSIYTGILSSPAQTTFAAENRLYESLREQWFKDKVDENLLIAWEQSRVEQSHQCSRKKLEIFRQGVIEAYNELQGASFQARDYWSRIFNARLRDFVRYLDPCSFTKEEMLIEEWQSRGKLSADGDQAVKIYQNKITDINDEIEILRRNPVQEGTIQGKEKQLKSCQIYLSYYQAQVAYQQQLSTAKDARQSQNEKAKSIESARNSRNQALWNLAPFVETSALCISGGGVRSASFALGALQGLARCSYDPGTNQVRGTLTEFDYISTVSGGGYIGSWLTRLATPTVGVPGASFTKAVRLLAEQRLAPKDPEPQPVRCLRDFTSYLAPQWSLFSGDTWTIITTYLRNVSLNWTMLIPIAMAMAALPLVDAGFMKALADSIYSARIFLLLASVTLVLALTLVALALPGDRLEQAKREWTSRFATRVHILVLLVSAYCFAAFSLKVPAITWLLLIPIVKSQKFIFLAAGGLGVWLWKFRSTEKTKAGGVSTVSYFGKYLLFSLMALIGWAAAIWLLLTHLLPNIQRIGERLDTIQQLNGLGYGFYTTTAVPVILLMSVLANWGLNGVMSAFELEEDREWWARSAAYILLISVGWFVLHFIVLFAAALLGKIAAVAVALLGPALSYIGYSPKTAAGPTSPKAGQLGKIGRFLARQSLLLPIFGCCILRVFSGAHGARRFRLAQSC